MLNGGLAKMTVASGGGTNDHNGRGPGLTHTSTALSNKERGLDESAAVHSKSDGDGGTGMT